MDVSSFAPARSLYVHVPFCARKCEYCAFYSTAADGALVNRYVGSLIREFELRRPDLDRRLETVFFGGGTPSLLTLGQWERVLGAMDRLGLVGAAEWSIECNPATVAADKARLLRDHGVNRISMGVQSLDEGLLDRLGRVHSRDMVFRSFEVLRSAGFDNINIDLMFGIPGQDLAIWQATLDEALALGSEHLSCYEVIYEQDTPLFEQLQAGEFEVDEELNAAMFDLLLERSDRAGFRQYEVANFARDRRVGTDGGPGGGCSGEGDRPRGQAGEIPSLACRHNVNYWQGGTYAACGPSGSGYERGARYRNLANTVGYCEALEAGRRPVDWEEHLSPLARAGEIAAFGLRMNAGWSWEAFRRVTGFDLREAWAAEIALVEARGWGRRDAAGFRLTPEGLRFADAAGSEFLRPEEGRVLAGQGARALSVVGGVRAGG